MSFHTHTPTHTLARANLCTHAHIAREKRQKKKENANPLSPSFRVVLRQVRYVLHNTSSVTLSLRPLYDLFQRKQSNHRQFQEEIANWSQVVARCGFHTGCRCQASGDQLGYMEVAGVAPQTSLRTKWLSGGHKEVTRRSAGGRHNVTRR